MPLPVSVFMCLISVQNDFLAAYGSAGHHEDSGRYSCKLKASEPD
jgi:hypothetical protein